MSNTDTYDALDGAWMGTPAAEQKDFDNLPDGKYQGALEGAAVDYWDDGTMYIKYTLRVAGGPHENGCAFKRSSFTTEAIPYIKRDFETLGIDPNRPVKQVIASLPAVIGAIIDFTVKTSKDKVDKNGNPLVNTFFNKLVLPAQPAAMRQNPAAAPRPAPRAYSQPPLPEPPPLRKGAFVPEPDDDTALPFDL